MIARPSTKAYDSKINGVSGRERLMYTGPS